MPDRKQERQLLGYLLGALDDSERERTEEQLAGDPALREKLARVEESLEPLRAALPVYRLPAGLAARTCRRVFAYSEALAGRVQEAGAVPRPPRHRARAMSPTAVPPSSTASWGWSDLVVAVGVFLAVSCSIFPAIQRSRMNTRLVACQDNLRRMGFVQSQCREMRGGFSSSLLPGSGVPTLGLPVPSFLSQAGAKGPSAASSVRPASNLSAVPSFAAGAGPYWGHPGFSQSVLGQNLLFLDGRVVFMSMGPVVDPLGEEAGNEGPLATAWPAWRDISASDPGDLAPIVLVGRPTP